MLSRGRWAALWWKIKPKKNIDNKISIRFSTINKSGALKEILDILDEHDLNMSYIDSRPSRKELGEYVFYVDFAGHIEDSNVFFALAEIQKAAKEFYILSEGAQIIAWNFISKIKAASLRP